MGKNWLALKWWNFLIFFQKKEEYTALWWDEKKSKRVWIGHLLCIWHLNWIMLFSCVFVHFFLPSKFGSNIECWVKNCPCNQIFFHMCNYSYFQRQNWICYSQQKKNGYVLAPFLCKLVPIHLIAKMFFHWKWWLWNMIFWSARPVSDKIYTIY